MDTSVLLSLIWLGLNAIGPALISLRAGPPVPGTSSSAVLEITVYAPRQVGPPVHITGFQSDRREFRLQLFNESDKPVAGVDVDIIDFAPRSCVITSDDKAQDSRYGFSEAEFPLRLAPHSTGVTSGVGTVRKGTVARTGPAQLPERSVHVAQKAGSAYMQVQLGIIAVYYEDGSTWPADWSAAGHPPSHPDAFDPGLVEAEADKCFNQETAAAGATALSLVRDVAFGEQYQQRPEARSAQELTPHLRFTCSLLGSSAVCHMPSANRRGAEKQ